ncbi:MAG: hypothetical protein OEX19_15345 [Gammaproteobacteria bacterium]|nr:hypothetical protein [Gammaproteobacteria bacterium]
MKRQSGVISVIEVLMIVMVMGLVAAVALPRLTTMQRESVITKESTEMVKSSYAAAIADLLTFPNSSELKEYVDASKVAVSDEGDSLLFNIEAVRMTVDTFADADCTVKTSSMYEPIQCVGDVAVLIK